VYSVSVCSVDVHNAVRVSLYHRMVVCSMRQFVPVCISVYQCVSVCISVYQCVSVCINLCSEVWVCMCGVFPILSGTYPLQIWHRAHQNTSTPNLSTLYYSHSATRFHIHFSINMITLHKSKEEEDLGTVSCLAPLSILVNRSEYKGWPSIGQFVYIW